MAKVVIKELYHKDLMGTLSGARAVFMSVDGMETEINGKVASGLHNAPYEADLNGEAPWKVKLDPEGSTLTYSIKLDDEETPCSGDLQMEIDRLQAIRTKAQNLKTLHAHLVLGSINPVSLCRTLVEAVGPDLVIGPLAALGVQLYNEACKALDGVEGVTVRYIKEEPLPITEQHHTQKKGGNVGEYVDISWPRDQPALFEKVQEKLGGVGSGKLLWTKDTYTLRLAHGTHCSLEPFNTTLFSYGTKRMQHGHLSSENPGWDIKANGEFTLCNSTLKEALVEKPVYAAMDASQEAFKRAYQVAHITLQSADKLPECRGEFTVDKEGVFRAQIPLDKRDDVPAEKSEDKWSKGNFAVGEPVISDGLAPIVAFFKDGKRAENLTAYTDLQRESVLAPVNSPLIIRIPCGTQLGGGVLAEDWWVKARRTEHVACKEGNFTYQLDNGMTIQGRFEWTHP